MLTDTAPAAPQVVLIGEGDNVPEALLDAANSVVALAPNRPCVAWVRNFPTRLRRRTIACRRRVAFGQHFVEKMMSCGLRHCAVMS